jgi:serine/threonine protein kinase
MKGAGGNKLGVGDYDFVSLLGRGCYGEVYRAINSKTHQEVAIKIVAKSKLAYQQKLLDLFKTEVKVMREITHPNILKCYELLESGNNYYMILFYCNGGSLEDIIKRKGRLTEEESLFILKQILNGFAELNKRNIMHRDIKTANIFLHDDLVVIGDFGFAKDGVELASTKLGSPLNMAPEILMAVGNVKYTSKCDIWSIGIVFYTMLFGKIPWDVWDVDSLKSKIISFSGPNLPFHSNYSDEVSEGSKNLLRQMLEPTYQKRIDWVNLFEHQIFKKPIKSAELKNESAENFDDNLDRSIVLRPHEDDVKDLFEQNAANQAMNEHPHAEYTAQADTGLKVNPLIYKKPEQMVDSYHQGMLGVGDQQSAPSTPRKSGSQGEISSTAPNSQNTELEICVSRYYHESKVTDFVFSTSKKARSFFWLITGEGKNLQISKTFDILLPMAAMLSKHAETMAGIMADSLEEGRDIFKLPQFVLYRGSPMGCKTVRDLRLLQMTYKQAVEENAINLNRCTSAITAIKRDELQRLCRSSLKVIGPVINELRQILQSLSLKIEELSKNAGSSFATEFRKLVCQTHLCVESDITFEYRKDNWTRFNWNEFRERINNETIDILLMMQSQYAFSG